MPEIRNLDDVVQHAGDMVGYLRNLSVGVFDFSGSAYEFSNWRDEQLAGHETVALVHQGHMRLPHSKMYIEGPDAFELLRYLGTNSFARFQPGVAKQYICCNSKGYIIGDCVLIYLDESKICLEGGTVVMEWIKYHAQQRGCNVTFSSKDMIRLPSGEIKPQPYYQFQLVGPHAKALFTRLNGSFPDIRFFHTGEIEIAGRKVHCLRHSMLGVPGLECWFPLEWRDEVIGAILQAGQDFGLKQLGTRTYPSQTLESGWMGLPIPAIYSGDELQGYRKTLAADSFEAEMSIAGSFVGNSMDDYYYNPFEMNYENMVRFDHDFVGREALENLAARPHGRKVTLEWNRDDVAKIHASYAGGDGDLPYKWMELPYSSYGMVQCDRVSRGDQLIGRSADVGYSHFARATISLAVVDDDVEMGDEVIVTWGEEDGGTRKAGVERHRQLDVRAIVRPAPYTRAAREDYRPT